MPAARSPTAGVSFDGGLWRAPESLSPTGPFLQLFGEHPEYTTSPDDSVRRGFFKRADYAEQDRATTVGAWQALHSRARPGYSTVVRGPRTPASAIGRCCPFAPGRPRGAPSGG